MVETEAHYEWLTIGKDKKFDDETLNMVKSSFKKLVDGQLFNASYIMIDNALFLLLGFPYWKILSA
ncbi:hypothetical protein ABRP72_14205 [Pectobacterium carotovorum]|uniref:hypothetical protein n=1 Tax=Pectobacterium carotovorum TaxID=554 RepID=UPI0032EEEA35